MKSKTITAQQQMSPQTDRETTPETTRMLKTVVKGGMESGMKNADAIVALMRDDLQITHDLWAAKLGKARNSIIKQIAKLKKVGLIRPTADGQSDVRSAVGSRVPRDRNVM